MTALSPRTFERVAALTQRVVVACGVATIAGCQLLFPLDLPADAGPPDARVDARAAPRDVAKDAPRPLPDAGHEGGKGRDAGRDVMSDAVVHDAPGLDAPADRAMHPDVADGGCDSGSDPDNCGFCGHTCLGGACEAGSCQPVTLVSSVVDPVALKAGAGSLYYTQGENVPPTGVQRVSVDGGGLATLAIGPAYFGDLAIDDTHAYYGLAPGMGVATLDASISGRQFIGNRGDVDSIALDELNVYWVDYGAGTIDKAAKDAGPDAFSHLVEYAGYDVVAGGLACASGQLWWTEPGSGGQHDVCHMSVVGGTPSCTPTAMGTVPGAITTDDAGGAYWVATSDAGGLVAGTNDIIYATHQNNPVQAWVDATDVYWVNQGTPPAYTDGSVWRTRKSAGGTTPATLLASNRVRPVSITGDGQAIYWLESGAPEPADAHDVEGQLIYPHGALVKLAK
jgi:hypothetical protein